VNWRSPKLLEAAKDCPRKRYRPVVIRDDGQFLADMELASDGDWVPYDDALDAARQAPEGDKDA